MWFTPKKRLLFFVAFSAMLSSGCTDPKTRSQDPNKSEKLELSGTTWYDYGNGLINLANITNITSSASISGEVMPIEYFNNKDNFYDYLNNLSAESRALVDAHADFCFNQLRASNLTNRYGYTWSAFNISSTLGAFEVGKKADDLAGLIKDLKASISPDFAQNCHLQLNGAAALNFDSFNVALEPYKLDIKFEKNEDGQFVKEEIDSKFDELTEDLQEGKTPWHGTYASLIER